MSESSLLIFTLFIISKMVMQFPQVEGQSKTYKMPVDMTQHQSTASASLQSQPQPQLTTTAPYYENSAEFMRRLNLSEKDQNVFPFSTNQVPPASSSFSHSSSNYLPMHPNEFYKDHVADNEEELFAQEVLPLIPLDPTHNVATCGSSRPCHDYDAIDPIRYILCSFKSNLIDLKFT